MTEKQRDESEKYRYEQEARLFELHMAFLSGDPARIRAASRLSERRAMASPGYDPDRGWGD